MANINFFLKCLPFFLVEQSGSQSHDKKNLRREGDASTRGRFSSLFFLRKDPLPILALANETRLAFFSFLLQSGLNREHLTLSFFPAAGKRKRKSYLGPREIHLEKDLFSPSVIYCILEAISVHKKDECSIDLTQKKRPPSQILFGLFFLKGSQGKW